MRAFGADGVERERPEPSAAAGEVRVRARAFVVRGGDRLQGDVVGEVIDAPGGELAPGQRVLVIGATAASAEVVRAPRAAVIPLGPGGEDAALATVPSTFPVAASALAIAASATGGGGAVLVRGGSSATGLAAIALARAAGWTVLATTRGAERAAALQEAGADYALVGEEGLAEVARAVAPGGVDAVIDLVGGPGAPAAAAAARDGGVVALVGTLDGAWPDPSTWASGARVVERAGEAPVDAAAVAGWCAEVAAGRLRAPLAAAVPVERLAEASAAGGVGRIAAVWASDPRGSAPG